MDELLLQQFHITDDDIRTSDERLKHLYVQHVIPPLQIELYCDPLVLDTSFTLDGPMPDHIFAGHDFYENIPNDIVYLNDRVNSPDKYSTFYKEHCLYWPIVVQKLGVLRLREYFAELRNRQRLENARNKLISEIRQYDRDKQIQESEKDMLLSSRCLKH